VVAGHALKRASGLIEATSPEDAAAVNQWFYHIIQKVADTDAEREFMGFGGTKVTTPRRRRYPRFLPR
jgi:hypothetical protein